MKKYVDLLKFKFSQKSTPLIIDTQEQDPRTHINNIQTKGFTVIKNAFSKTKAEGIIRDYNEWCNARKEMVNTFKKSSGMNSRLVNFHTVSKEAFSIFENEKLLSVTDSFFNAETVVYTSLFFQEGTEQDIHRDGPLFCTFPEQLYLGVWFALEDANETNGALKVIPEGHKLSHAEFTTRNKLLEKHFPHSTSAEEIGFVNLDLWNDYQQWVRQDSFNLDRKVDVVTVNCGDIIIWHPMLPHGGSKIFQKGKSRYSMVMHVTPAETEVHGCYLYFAPHLPFTSRKMCYKSSTSALARRFFIDNCVFMKDE